jgi:putative endonuclease
MRTLGPASKIDLQIWTLRKMDALANRLRRSPRTAEHLATGILGEREALFHLQKKKYIIVARRWKSAKLRGDVDLIGWDGEWLCFIEVKTRRGRDPMSPAESAVNEDKHEMLRKMARAYLHTFPEKSRRDIPVRFDIVSVYLLQTEVEFEVYQGAFGWQTNTRVQALGGKAR